MGHAIPFKVYERFMMSEQEFVAPKSEAEAGNSDEDESVESDEGDEALAGAVPDDGDSEDVSDTLGDSPDSGDAVDSDSADTVSEDEELPPGAWKGVDEEGA